MRKLSQLNMISAAITASIFVALVAIKVFGNQGMPDNNALAGTGSTFEYNFSVAGVLHESGTMSGSSSPGWWLRSGGKLILSGGTGKSIQGRLATNDPVRLAYAKSASKATDNGYHPQNLFRLFTKNSWDNLMQEIYVTVKNHNYLNPDNANAWNGITLISRYIDNNNYYYASVRADGNTTIKKKKNGVHYTLTAKKVLDGTYGRNTNPSLIPVNKTIGLKSEALNNSNGTVTLRFYLNTGNGWIKTVEATDNGSVGGAPILNAGLAAIYSDYMDIEMDNYKAVPLSASPAPAVSANPSPLISATPRPSATPTPTPTPPVLSNVSTLFSDSFAQYPNGLITNEYAFWNPNDSSAKKSAAWEMTSGSLFAQNGAGWTGVPDAKAPNSTSSTGNNSAIFRLTTKQSNFGDVAVTFDLLNQGLTSTSVTPAVDWDGIHVFLRYQSEEHLYYATVNRRDNTVVVKKKTPGGPSNGGTYVTLKSAPNTVPYNVWHKVKATVDNNTDGSVTIKLYVNDKLLLTSIDNGSIGGAPIRTAGKVGIRGDNANLKFKNFTVSPL